MSGYRVRYQTYEFGFLDVHLCSLRGHQEYFDPEGIAEDLGIPPASWPFFGVVWPSSEVLAHFVLDFDTHSKRILEVGCGVALSSHLLNLQGSDISATDRHPEVDSFLKINSELNKGPSINYERIDWKEECDNLGHFDLIIGSDLLYEDELIVQLANFIQKHANQECEVILVDPGRGRTKKFENIMTEYGFTCTYEKPINPALLDFEFKGKIILFSRDN